MVGFFANGRAMCPNRPLIAGIALCALVMTVLEMIGCGISDHMTRGKGFIKAHEFNRAILEFKTAIRAKPNDAEAYYELGRACEAARDFQSAVNAYERATQLNPKHTDAQVRLAGLMAVAGNEQILKEAKNRLTSVIDEKSSADAFDALALTELRLGEMNLAIQNLEQTLARFPSDRPSAILLAYADVQKHDPRSAEKVLRQACLSEPKSAAIRIALGRFYYRENRRPDAQAAFEDALRVDPKNEQALLDLALVQAAQGHSRETEDRLRRLASLNDVNYRSDYGIYLFRIGRSEDAIREFERIYKLDPKIPESRTRLIDAYEQTGRAADAERLLTETLRTNPNDSGALLERGELLIGRGRYDEAERDLNQVFRFSTNSAELHYALAHLHNARNETATYRQELSEALRLKPDILRIRLELSRAYAATGDFAAGIATLDAAPSGQKNEPGLLVQRNWILWASGDLAGMRKGVDALTARDRSSDVLLQEGILKAQKRDFAGARAALEESLAKNAANVQAMKALAMTYVAEKQIQAGLARIREYAACQPKSPQVQEFAGQMFRSVGDWKAARAAFLQARAADPNFAEADISLVQMDAHDGKWEDAKKRLKSMLERNPDDNSARLSLANIEEAHGSQAQALAEYRKLVQDDPQNAQVLNNLAYALSENNRPDEALKYAEKAHELLPNDSTIEDTLAWIFYRKGLYDMAVHYLEETSSRNLSALVRYHLAMAYAKAGMPDRGRSIFETALKMNPDLPEAKAAGQMFAGN